MKLFSSKNQPNSENDASESGDAQPGIGLFGRLTRTREGLFGGIAKIFSSQVVDEQLFEEIEDQLLVADVGINVSQKIVAHLRQDMRQNKITDEASMSTSLRAVLLQLIENCEVSEFDLAAGRPKVLMMVGVNGVGKTTTLAKIASRYKARNNQVMLAACDTFRAAAIEQLQTWGRRLDIPVIAQSHGADAAAVAYDAYTAAHARHCDILLIDTAGRQHTDSDLIEQLKKVKRVLAKADSAIPDEVWLTVDAGNGQNVISQVQHFHQAVSLTGLCITKLDGTAKGGIVFALAEKFGLPIAYIGTGESAEDLRQFKAQEFVDALIPYMSPSSDSV